MHQNKHIKNPLKIVSPTKIHSVKQCNSVYKLCPAISISPTPALSGVPHYFNPGFLPVQNCLNLSLLLPNSFAYFHLETVLCILSLHILLYIPRYSTLFIFPQINPDSVQPTKIYTIWNYIKKLHFLPF